MFHAACLAVSVYVTVGVRLSVSQSVSSIDSSSDVQPVCCSSGAGGRYRCCRRPSPAAGSVVLRAEVRGSTQTCLCLVCAVASSTR